MITAQCPTCGELFTGAMADQRCAKHARRCGHTSVKQGLILDEQAARKVANRRVKEANVARRPLLVSKVVRYVPNSPDNSNVENNHAQDEREAQDSQEGTIQDKIDEEFVTMLKSLGDVEAQYLIDFIRSGKTISFGNVAQMKAVRKRLSNTKGHLQWIAHHIQLTHSDLPKLIGENEKPVEFIFNAPDGLQLLRAAFSDFRNKGYMVLRAKKAMNARENRQGPLVCRLLYCKCVCEIVMRMYRVS